LGVLSGEEEEVIVMLYGTTGHHDVEALAGFELEAKQP
jgi:hypothetical protein